MILTADPKPPTIAVTVLTAALTTAATLLVTWGIDELRSKYGTTPKSPDRTEVSK